MYQCLQKQEQLSESELRNVYEFFIATIERLERYIERKKNVFKWLSVIVVESKESNIKESIGNLEAMKEYLSILLPDLYNKLKDESNFLREELMREYYNWINKTGIDINDCHPELKKLLFEFNEALEGKEGNLIEKLRSRSNLNVSFQELDSFFDSIQIPLKSSLEWEEELVKWVKNHREKKHLASLIKQRSETKDKILGNIEEVIRFKTWWSDYNVATVINYHNGYYQVFLVIYEPPQKDGKIKEVLEVFEINNGYDKNSLDSAKSKTTSLRVELNRESQILAIIGSHGSTSPSIVLSEPYILEKEIPCKMETYTYQVEDHVPYASGTYHRGGIWIETREVKAERRIYPSNPDEHLNPLDIVKVKNKKGVAYFHFAVYLGKGKVSHITQDNKGVKIENWSDFLDGAVGELVRYHSVIPFKKWDDTVRHIAKATIGHYKRGEYNLCNDNCEHYAWEQITGIDYSRQAIERPNGASIVDFLRGRGTHGVTCWTSVNLQSMIRNSNQKFDSLKSSEDYWVKEKIREIKGSENEWQSRIEVPIKDDCRIM